MPPQITYVSIQIFLDMWLGQGFYCCDKPLRPQSSYGSQVPVLYGEQAGQELRAGTGAEGTEEQHLLFCSHGLLSLPVTAPRTTSPGRAPPTVNWTLPDQSPIKRTTGLLTGQLDGDIFVLIKVPFPRQSWLESKTSQHNIYLIQSN